MLKKLRATRIRPAKFRRWEELGFRDFLLILYFGLYAELPLTSKVVLCVDQKGKFLPSDGYCDIQLWILKLLSVLKLARVSHTHQADLYLQFGVTVLASCLSLFEVGVTRWLFMGENWQHSINLDKVHVTLDYVYICSGKKWEHLSTAWEHIQLRGQVPPVLGKLMLQYKHHHSLSHITVYEECASHPYKLTGKKKYHRQTTGILHILIFK